MSSAILKLPFILANAVSAQMALTPPNPPPKADERSKYEADKRTKDLLDMVFWWYMPIVWTFIHVFSAIEAFVILSSTFPFLRHPILDQYLVPKSTSVVLAHLRITPTFLVGSVILFVSSLLRVICYRTLGKHFTFNLAIRKDHKLITDGPYAIVRHPSYLAMVIYAIGLTLTQFGEGSWWRESGISSTTLGKILAFFRIVFPNGLVLLLLNRIPKEDLVLKNEFGKEWEEWVKRTPYGVIPGIY